MAGDVVLWIDRIHHDHPVCRSLDLLRIVVVAKGNGFKKLVLAEKREDAAQAALPFIRHPALLHCGGSNQVTKVGGLHEIVLSIIPPFHQAYQAFELDRSPSLLTARRAA